MTIGSCVREVSSFKDAQKNPTISGLFAVGKKMKNVRNVVMLATLVVHLKMKTSMFPTGLAGLTDACIC